MALSAPSDSLPELAASDIPAEYRREFLEIVALTDGLCAAGREQQATEVVIENWKAKE